MVDQSAGPLGLGAPGPATARDERRIFVGGAFVDPMSDAVLSVENPATGESFGSVPDAGEADVDVAVRAAHEAFGDWSRTPVHERRAALVRFTEALAARREELARLVTTEMGTPLALSREVQADLPVAVLNAFIEALDVHQETEELGSSLVVREPAGVVAAITPWNYPIHQAVSKIGAALAVGCTVVLKPSQVTPLSAFLLAEAAVEAELPPGVLNVVTGTGRVAGNALTAHPLVDVVSFTGSTSGGSQVMKTAAGTIKRVCLELGGKSANVILDDADLERAVRRGVEFVLENSGQTCTAWSRMLVPAEQQDDVLDLVRQHFAAVRVGDPFDPSTTMGPVANAQQQEVVRGYVASGIADGATVAAGSTEERGGRGHYVNPVAFANVRTEMTIAQEEIFGPVLAVLPYRDEAHALEIANDSIYGLSGAVWSGDQERALSFARRMQTGQVSVNGGRWNPGAPFGGYKQSGLGRELGRFGFDDFLEIKSIQL